VADTPARLFCVLGEAEITLREIIAALIDHPAASKEHMSALFHSLERLKVGMPEQGMHSMYCSLALPPVPRPSCCTLTPCDCSKR
jgi:hypothetical protein